MGNLLSEGKGDFSKLFSKKIIGLIKENKGFECISKYCKDMKLPLKLLLEILLPFATGVLGKHEELKAFAKEVFPVKIYIYMLFRIFLQN